MTKSRWFSEERNQYIDLDSVSREDLVRELGGVQKRYDDLLGEWERDHEAKRAFVELVLKGLRLVGRDVFDAETEKAEFQEVFDGLFCESKD